MGLSKVFCRLGWHRFEQNPSTPAPMRDLKRASCRGVEVIQPGELQCQRTDCDSTRQVVRSGWLGNDSVIRDCFDRPVSWRARNSQSEEVLQRYTGLISR